MIFIKNVLILNYKSFIIFYYRHDKKTKSDGINIEDIYSNKCNIKV
jgi:hypothetical protein